MSEKTQIPDESEIIAQGKADYFSHRGVYANPYKAGPPAHFNAYERGWMQSLKRDGASLVDTPPPDAGSWYRIEPLKPAVNEYALLKGRDGPRRSK
ncbi:hypothetical protein BH10PSE16_BH10PSE16_28470 [soil metagenome]